jgi:hypothetical protein
MVLSKCRIPGFVIILFQNMMNRNDADPGNSTRIAGVRQESSWKRETTNGKRGNLAYEEQGEKTTKRFGP